MKNQQTSTRLIFRIALSAVFLATAAGAFLPATAFAAESPASAKAVVDAANISLGNDFIELTWSLNDGVFRPGVLRNRITGEIYPLGDQAFVLTRKNDDGKLPPILINASKLIADGPAIIETLPANPQALRRSERVAGKAVTVHFSSNDDGLAAVWRAELRDGEKYARISLQLTPEIEPVSLTKISLAELPWPDARVVGTVQGSPIVSGNAYAGLEHPMSENTVASGNASCALTRKLPLATRKPWTVSAILGVTSPGQLRRDFQYYVESERPRPYQPFFNYNTWYDIGYFSRYGEKDAVDTINTYGEELTKKRGVKIDSFLMDDGWDDTATLWQFNKNFPDGFKNVRAAAESCGAGPGVWFSPWGGYGPPHDARIKEGKARGFETYTAMDDETKKTQEYFALSGPKYYANFHAMCERMIKEYGVNQFKLDGTGDADRVVPGSKFGSDFEAAIALIADLRKIKPDIYINLTTGTWPSPFWLQHADSIWRGNSDHEFIGVGSARNRWMTYRDAEVYKNNVVAGPLFPINSLMLHGVIYAKSARNLNTDPDNDLPKEIWTAFACGTQMEELYITPALLSEKNWDTLASAAKWARANQNTLRDVHWVGGNPERLEVYGWGAWSPEKGILTLRNPSSQPKEITLTLAAAFELPVGASVNYTITTPGNETTKPEFSKLTATAPATFKLPPFGVMVLEATPAKE